MIETIVSRIKKQTLPAEPHEHSIFTQYQIRAAVEPVHNIFCECLECLAIGWDPKEESNDQNQTPESQSEKSQSDCHNAYMASIHRILKFIERDS